VQQGSGSGRINKHSTAAEQCKHRKQAAKQGKAKQSEAASQQGAASSKAKEQAQQQLERNWEASNTSPAPWFSLLNM
jgi:hypothetical protein